MAHLLRLCLRLGPKKAELVTDESQQKLGRLFGLATFASCPHGPERLYLLSYMSARGPGRATIHPCGGRLVTMGTTFSFFIFWPVWFLMYLSAQLVQIASSIIGIRYENVEPCTVAQTRCYDCNLEALWGRPTSKLKGEKESMSVYQAVKEKKQLTDFIYFSLHSAVVKF